MEPIVTESLPFAEPTNRAEQVATITRTDAGWKQARVFGVVIASRYGESGGEDFPEIEALVDQINAAAPTHAEADRAEDRPAEQYRLSLWADIDSYASVVFGPDKAAFLAARAQLSETIDRLVSVGGRQEARPMSCPVCYATVPCQHSHPLGVVRELSGTVTAGPAAGAADDARDAPHVTDAEREMLGPEGAKAVSDARARLYAAIDADKAKDAARYRWLRDIGDATWRPFALREGCSAELADAALDAAIAAHQPKAPA